MSIIEIARTNIVSKYANVCLHLILLCAILSISKEGGMCMEETVLKLILLREKIFEELEKEST